LLEHAMSPKIEARMVEVLGRPGTCPHGNPIPGMGYELPKDLVTLDSIEDGEAVIEVVTEEAELDLRLLHFLDVNGVRPGVHVRVLEHAPFNQTTTLQVGERTVTLGLAAAHKILARRAVASRNGTS
ncbi:MAG TPA: metal-dependent transcriptional regulator, partial [Dehalococcoidia bacterium]